MAGVSTKEIKNRIKSMESTRQITKAMEMVAASKLRKTQAQMVSSKPYFELLYSTVMQIAETNRDFSSAYLQKREGGKALYIVIAGDRGLAGGYNSNVLKLASTHMQGQETMALPIGRRAVEWFKTKGVSALTVNYAEAGAVSLGDCFSLAKRVCACFRNGECDRVYVCYTKFESVLSQVPVCLELLPLTRLSSEGQQTAQKDILYEPDCEQVFDAIVPEYLGGVLYGALCQSRASEQAARRTAMDSATQNADEMIGQLSLQFNRARQAAITQEITEIVAGSQ